MNEPATLTSLGKRDLASVFHPMTQIAALNEQGPMMIVRGEGILCVGRRRQPVY